ncbi:hypothetical protein CC86DRAFT_7369 [Ophiobolus disseminans]|uniref:Uncharacterized protein n=1 Tax=Ophiobolus disseminans TaxID=1469910 RepID=A0A6A7AJ55_9PLEO|nr:hypothetical protein CC86DRAFT_7369 [Ophiobolus disseminans]
MTNLGPMTTAFSPPTSCSTAILGYCARDACTAQLGNTCTTPSGEDGFTNALQHTTDAACWPSGTQFLSQTYDSSIRGYATSLYFSPASNCPAGWSTVTVGDDTNIFPGISAGEAGVICCLSYVDDLYTTSHN